MTSQLEHHLIVGINHSLHTWHGSSFKIEGSLSLVSGSISSKCLGMVTALRGSNVVLSIRAQCAIDGACDGTLTATCRFWRPSIEASSCHDWCHRYSSSRNSHVLSTQSGIFQFKRMAEIVWSRLGRISLCRCTMHSSCAVSKVLQEYKMRTASVYLYNYDLVLEQSAC